MTDIIPFPYSSHDNKQINAKIEEEELKNEPFGVQLHYLIITALLFRHR